MGKSSIDQIRFSDALFDAANQIFKTMAGITVSETVEAEVEPEGPQLLGSITFDGTIRGCLAVSCSVPCARTITGKVQKIEQHDAVYDEMVFDTMGKIAKTIMEQVARAVKDEAGPLSISLPSVSTGKSIRSSIGQSAKKITVWLNLGEGETVQLLLLYKPNTGKKN